MFSNLFRILYIWNMQQGPSFQKCRTKKEIATGPFMYERFIKISWKCSSIKKGWSPHCELHRVICLLFSVAGSHKIHIEISTRKFSQKYLSLFPQTSLKIFNNMNAFLGLIHHSITYQLFFTKTNKQFCEIEGGKKKCCSMLWSFNDYTNPPKKPV